MKRAVGKNEKLESFAEVGKSQAKLERTERSWKESSEVGKLLSKLESFAEVGKRRCSWKVLTEVGKFIKSSKLGLGKLTN